jgi:hypothetical protein
MDLREINLDVCKDEHEDDRTLFDVVLRQDKSTSPSHVDSA